MSVDTFTDETITDVQPEATNGGILDVVTETITYAVTKDPASGKLGFSEYKENTVVYNAINGENPTLELLQKVNVSYPTVHTLAGISQAVPDEDEAISIFNKGLAAKVTTRVRAYFHEVDEAGNLQHTDETDFDASEFAAEPMKRRSMTDTQKLVKTLKNVSPEALQEALKAMGLL